MSREIKFRAWNPELRKMLYEIEEINISDENIVGEIKHGVLEVKYMKASGLWVDAPVMQYCKYFSVEFYEGDIMAIPCDCDSEYGCTHRDGIYIVVWSEEYAGFSLKSNTTGRLYALDEFGEENMHIIGNIYENPELLETQGNK